MSDLLDGKSAVVTGCNRGIGKAILMRFAENECKTIFAVIRKENEEFSSYVGELMSRTGCDIIPVYADFSVDGGVKVAIKEIMHHRHQIDILVNNIGTNYTQKSFSLMKMEEISDTLQINFLSHLRFTQGISRCMLKGGHGSIIFMSSAAAYDGGGNVAYVSSKAAMIGAVKRLAIEFNEFGIRVNAIAPGVTETDMLRTLSDEDEDKALSMQIMHRMAKPEEIADTAVFLGSFMSSFITGQVIHVDGGVR